MTRRAVTFLLTSVGRRVELVRHFLEVEAADPERLRVIGTEIDPYAPAAQLLGQDRLHVVPRVDDPGYAPHIRALCEDHDVNAVFPLIDPDIPALGAAGSGVPLAAVSPEMSEVVSDKSLTHDWLARVGVPTPRTWEPDATRDEDLPAFIKPRRGSSGIGAHVVADRAEHDFHAARLDAPIVQELMAGPEVTIDVIVGRAGETLAMVQRQRMAVRGGEVSRGVVVQDDTLDRTVESVVAALQPTGPVTVQGMYDAVGNFKETEVNARMGGGLPLAIAAGVPVAEVLRDSWAGLAPSRVAKVETGLQMVRFDESFFFRP